MQRQAGRERGSKPLTGTEKIDSREIELEKEKVGKKAEDWREKECKKEKKELEKTIGKPNILGGDKSILRRKEKIQGPDDKGETRSKRQDTGGNKEGYK